MLSLYLYVYVCIIVYFRGSTPSRCLFFRCATPLGGGKPTREGSYSLDMLSFFFPLYLYLYLSLYISLSISLSLYLSLYTYIYIYICIHIFLFICVSFFVSQTLWESRFLLREPAVDRVPKRARRRATATASRTVFNSSCFHISSRPWGFEFLHA